jgi:hypothetical protein
MELKDFVSESIKQIIDGVNEAKRYADNYDAMVNPRRWSWNSSNVLARYESNTGAAIENIEFDVAVTVTEGTNTKGGIGVFVGPVGIGSQGQSENSNSSVSRLKFSVPIVLPFTDNPKMENETQQSL